jgi:pyruvate formate lyase activating enzyme
VTGTVFNIMRFSVHDGPGIRTTVFLKGCPLQCRWCHNPEALSGGIELLYRPERCLRCGDCVAACEQGAIALVGEEIVTHHGRCVRCGACVDVCAAEARELVGRAMTVEEVMREVLKDVAFFDESGGGMTVSGGEPFFQAEFLIELLSAGKRRHLHTALDTTGFTTPETLARVVPLTDLFLYDLKSLDDTRHRELTGVPNAPILANLRALVAGGAHVILRVPVIPGTNDSPADVQAVGEFVAGLARPPQIHLLPYHRTALEKYRRFRMACPMPDVAAASPERMEALAERLRSSGLSVRIGG